MVKNVINSNTFTCIGYFPSLVMKLSKSSKVISWGKTERSPSGSICGPSRKLIGLMAVYLKHHMNGFIFIYSLFSAWRTIYIVLSETEL